LKREIGRKPLAIPGHRLIQAAHFHPVEHCQVGVEHHLFTAHEKDELRNVFRFQDDYPLGYQRSHLRGETLAETFYDEKPEKVEGRMERLGEAT